MVKALGELYEGGVARVVFRKFEGEGVDSSLPVCALLALRPPTAFPKEVRGEERRGEERRGEERVVMVERVSFVFSRAAHCSTPSAKRLARVNQGVPGAPPQTREREDCNYQQHAKLQPTHRHSCLPVHEIRGAVLLSHRAGEEPGRVVAAPRLALLLQSALSDAR